MDALCHWRRRLLVYASTVSASALVFVATACSSEHAVIADEVPETGVGPATGELAEPAPSGNTVIGGADGSASQGGPQAVEPPASAVLTGAESEMCEHTTSPWDSEAEAEERCAALLECVADGWGPPDGSDLFLGRDGLWGGATPQAALVAAFESGAESPVVRIADGYGAALWHRRTITANDIIELLTAAAEREPDQNRVVTSTYALRMAEPAPGTIWAEEGMMEEWDALWSAAGSVDVSGGWFLDVADLDSPWLGPTRIGMIDGIGLWPDRPPGAALPAPPICPGHDPLGGVVITEATPLSQLADISGSGFVDGRIWRQMIGLMLNPELGPNVLIDASAAATLDHLGIDVHQVGVAAMIQPALPEWAEFWEVMTSDLFDDELSPCLEHLFAEPVLLAVVLEIDGDGRLLAAEWDMAAPTQNATRGLFQLPPGDELCEELAQLYEIPGLVDALQTTPDVEEASWRFTWRVSGEDPRYGLDHDSVLNALSVWRSR